MEEHGGPSRVSSERRGHSRIGIASLVIAILATLILVVGFVIIFAVGGQLAGGADPQDLTPQELQSDLADSPVSAAAVLVAGISILVSPLLYLLGLALGIAGSIQGRRKRLFAILGSVFNGLAVLLLGGLFVLGALVGGA